MYNTLTSIRVSLPVSLLNLLVNRVPSATFLNLPSYNTRCPLLALQGLSGRQAKKGREQCMDLLELPSMVDHARPLLNSVTGFCGTSSLFLTGWEDMGSGLLDGGGCAKCLTSLGGKIDIDLQEPPLSWLSFLNIPRGLSSPLTLIHRLSCGS